MEPKLLFRFFELKGLVESLKLMSEYDEECGSSSLFEMIDNLSKKTNELTDLLETSV